MFNLSFVVLECNFPEETIMKRLIPILLGILLGLYTSAVIAQEAAPKEIRGGILNGKAVSLPRPEYSDAARAAKLEGTVVVDVTIDEAGNVISAKVPVEPQKIRPFVGYDSDIVEITTVDPILVDAAERAALGAKFSPTQLSGQPVKVSGRIVYRFTAQISKDGVHQNGNPVMNDVATSLPAPEYPAAAKAVKAQGAVGVYVTIDEKGNVIAARIMSGHPLLRAAAIEAAKLAKFTPTIVDGEAVKFAGTVTYNFVLPKDPDQ